MRLIISWDAELDNFIGQESVNVQSQTPSRLSENSTSVFPPPREIKDTTNQPTKPGYFTSIFSSIPSLSSTKTNSSGLQISQASENTSGATHNPYILSQRDQSSESEIPRFLATNPQDFRNTNSSESAAFGSTGTIPNRPLPTVPPSLSQPAHVPISYRLGNRRMKYAPPPDLTSNNAKPYSNPAVQTFFPNQNVSASPSILNPYQSDGSQDSSSSVQQPNSSLEKSLTLERNISPYSSFRSSPVAGVVHNPSTNPFANQNPFSDNFSTPTQIASKSLSRAIPPRAPEPATPQNTPANVSFPGLSPSQDLLPILPNSDKPEAALKAPNQLNLPEEVSKNNTFDTSVESVIKPTLISGEIETTFAPISAAKVTEKLEHLLVEQKEDPSGEATSRASLEVINKITSAAESAKSLKPQSETLQATNESIDKLYEIKLNDTEVKTAQSGSDTWSDVFLGQEPATQSVTSSEVHTADNNSVLTDTKADKSDAHPSRQLYQAPPIFASISAFDVKPADQKSSLNYVPPIPLSQQTNFYPPPPQSATAFVEAHCVSAPKADQFSNPSYQDKNASFDQTVIDAAKNQLQETSAFNSKAIVSTSSIPIDSTACMSVWSADQSSQQQVLNSASNQSAYSSQIYTAPSQPPQPPPIFYNPTQFANELPTQSAFPQTYNQHSPQQQSYQNPHFYGSTSGQQQFYTTPENNSAYPSAVSMATTVPEPTGSATLNPVQMSVNSPTNRSTPDTVPPSFQNWASGSSDKCMQYRPIYHHWFYRKEVESKTLWLPFSMQDSLKLENAHNSSDITPETIVATDGGRYDVDILRRQRVPVYWTGASSEVRRCSWFFKGATESRYVPYNETTAAKLEEEYKQACLTNNWNRKIELNNGEYIVFHSATVQVHYLQPTSPELAGSWGNSAGSEDSTYLQGATSRPRVVKRGVDEFHIEEGEPEKVDHLLFLVHGIGSVCDLKFRTVEEVVDEFRSISLQLVQSHYRTASEQGIVSRIEVLPISWHTTLHSDDTGIDKKLQAITLESIPKLRHFTNDTLLDVLFYTSPTYCQTIMHTVGSEMNRLHALFKDRNPSFDGGIYLGGHSLGSLIMFDLLCHQNPVQEEDEDEKRNDDDVGSDKGGEDDSIGPIRPMPTSILKRRLSRKISYVMGIAGTGQPYIHYPQLNFHPRAFFAFGSPIGMFVTVRGIDTLGENFILPTCPAFFNIFHPFDPVAYRVESLINPEASKYRPMLIPHHKGRKRMHLELKETMARVGADLKQKIFDSVKHTWNTFYQLTLFHKPDNQALEREIDKVVEEQLQKTPNVSDQQNNDDGGADLKIGQLNGGRRIDYVLQEAPFEYINEYIFALTSHICYWESEDTMLLILKEIYGSRGIQTDAQLPQQTMSIERVSPSPSLYSALSVSNSNVGTPSVPVAMGIDPTMPMTGKPVGPPPKTGFVPKS
ncbi:uncharacterized protein [Linepithema humile]|uniref:uncharacterized protein isoform X3 n=1 Tax=Linepithema humile TaxID=83485 RepID=UPI0006232B64|nr:PREDICTED: uncharacterized protein LOC105676861 isoform X3 [Linepithema humile]